MRFRNRLVTSDLFVAKNLILPVTALLILGACGEDPNALIQDQNLPSERSGIEGESVDGLTVGHRLMEAGEYELALRAYTRTINDYGVTVDVLSAIGSANLKLGRLGQAEEYLRQAIAQDDSFVPAWNNLGVILVTREEYSEAREVFRVAYGLDRGESTEIRSNLLLAEAKMQDIAPPVEEEANFRLVRRGNGQYLLLGN
jgi:Flp pilus assembly protein TadD